jgi:hypothetical protein
MACLKCLTKRIFSELREAAGCTFIMVASRCDFCETSEKEAGQSPLAFFRFLDSSQVQNPLRHSGSARKLQPV